MPDTIAATALLDATSKILESMFFATVFGEAGQPSAGADMIGASVTFDGRLRGSLAVATDSETARTLAADFLALGFCYAAGAAHVGALAARDARAPGAPHSPA